MTSVKISQIFFDQQSCSWDENIGEDKVNRIENIFNNKILTLKAPVLDLGSGTGILLPVFKKYGISNNSVFEMDISLKMLLCARAKYENQYDTHYIQADGHLLPLAPDCFGSAICFQVFPHFLDKYKAANEIFSTLNKNGVLVILHLMGHYELNELHRQTGHAVEKDRILPAEKLAQLLVSAGFNIKHVEESTNLYLIIGQKS
ncbi:class I SAM-dependent methyltransferase [Calditrichota bacterium]